MGKVIQLKTAYALMKTDADGMVWAVSIHDTRKEAETRCEIAELVNPDCEYQIWETRYTEDDSMPDVDKPTQPWYEMSEADEFFTDDDYPDLIA
jgi:hypothetical protein